MSKLLDSYRKKRVSLMLEMDEHPNKQTFALLQEVTYRISIYETFQVIYHASKFMAYKDYAEHYRMFDGFVKMILPERCFSSVDPDTEAKRKTAYNSLWAVVTDYRKKYSSYRFRNPCDYIDDISETMNAFLSVWLAHRNTYFEIIGV